MATALASLPRTRPGTALESFAISPSGAVRRTVRRRDGTLVHTDMGRARLRSGETTAEAADRALLRSRIRPAVGSGEVLRAVDAYGGCGGLGLGLWEACRALGISLEVAGVFDLDRSALDVYTHNLPVRLAYRQDVAKLVNGRGTGALTKSERALKKEIGRVDFLLAGPPCQGFTALNNHTRGNDPRNTLYRRAARMAFVLKPRFVLIENVASVTSDVDEAARRTIADLRRLGYSVSEGVVALADLGVPQLRRRHVVVAARDRKPDVAAITNAFKRDRRDLRWAIGDLTRRHGAQELDRASAPSKDNKRRMRWLRENDEHDLPNERRPDCHQGDHSYKSMYGRLWWDRPAQTITSGYGSMGQGRYVHPDGRRTLTAHEAARIQFFADWWDWRKYGRTRWATLIGNAVPPKLGYVIALWLLR